MKEIKEYLQLSSVKNFKYRHVQNNCDLNCKFSQVSS